MVVLALAGVPEVSAGPDLADRATVLEAPIDQVTVFSDRAQVRRRATAQLAVGIHALRLPDLPGATLLDTLRVTGDGGRVLRVEATPVERERTGIDQVEGLIAKVEAGTDRLAVLDGQIRAREWETAVLVGLQPKPAPIRNVRAARFWWGPASAPVLDVPTQRPAPTVQTGNSIVTLPILPHQLP
jgi:hypothetical protein